MSGASFSERWKAGSALVGFFARLRDSAAYEILAQTSADFTIIDMEHGSFDRALLAQCILACRAQRLPALVRVPDEGKSTIQHAIGVGADGIIVPHVNSADTIADVMEFARTRGFERAYAGATRISNYRGDTWADFTKRETGKPLIIAQIDEPPGIAAADDIAAVAGLDGVFLGQIGLTLALGNDADAAAAALERVCHSATRQNLPVGLSLPDERMAAAWRRRGVSLFAIDSDQNLLKSAAAARVTSFRKRMEPTDDPTPGS